MNPFILVPFFVVLLVGVYYPQLQHITADVREALARDARARHATELMAAIEADNAEGVDAWASFHDPVPADAWRAAVKRAHPDVIQSLLCNGASPVEPLDDNGLSALDVTAAHSHCGGRDDQGVAALRVLLHDWRVTTPDVIDALEAWADGWMPGDPGEAARMDVLLGHAALDMFELAHNPRHHLRVHGITRRIAEHEPNILGHVISGDAANALRTRELVAFAISHEHDKAVVRDWLDRISLWADQTNL